MTFKQWMKKQVMRDDAIGDLAKDLQQDTSQEYKKLRNNYAAWRKHLKTRMHWSIVLSAFEDAWSEYETGEPANLKFTATEHIKFSEGLYTLLQLTRMLQADFNEKYTFDVGYPGAVLKRFEGLLNDIYIMQIQMDMIAHDENVNVIYR